jgi:hypothetical protein
MRWVRGTASAAVMIIAFYFVVRWGGEALRVFVSPSYGLEEFGRSQEVFSVSHALGLHGYTLFRVAAFFGAFKLVGAVAFALHLADRARALAGRRAAEHQMLEAGLLLVVLLSLAIAWPALIQNNASLVRDCELNLALAAVAAILNIAERYAPARAKWGTAPSASAALDRAVAEARAEIPPQRSSLLRRLSELSGVARITTAVDMFVRRWKRDFGAMLWRGTLRGL